MSSSSAENGSASSGGDSGSCESSQPGSTCASTGSSPTRSRYDDAHSRAAAVDVPVLHRREDALERVLEPRRMDGGDDPVERRELRVGHVERAVGLDVDLDAAEDAKRRDLLLQPCDLLRLSLEPPFAKVV